VRHAYSARRSRSVEGDVDQLGPRFAMLEPISDHAKRECLDLGLGLGRSAAVRQDTGKLRHFRDPAPVILTFKLNLDPQANPPRASLPQTAPRIHRHARLTLELSCEAPKFARLRLLQLLVRRLVPPRNNQPGSEPPRVIAATPPCPTDQQGWRPTESSFNPWRARGVTRVPSCLSARRGPWPTLPYKAPARRPMTMPLHEAHRRPCRRLHNSKLLARPVPPLSIRGVQGT